MEIDAAVTMRVIHCTRAMQNSWQGSSQTYLFLKMSLASLAWTKGSS